MMNRHGITWPRVAFAAVLLLALFATLDAAFTWLDARDLDDRAAELSTRLTKATQPATDKRADTPGASQNRQPQPVEQNTPAAAAVDRIRKRHLFAPAPPEAFRNIQGVLGDRVLYAGGQSFTVGDNAMGATITAIGSDWVELQHDGQTIKLHVFGEDGNRRNFQGGDIPNPNERRGRRNRNRSRPNAPNPRQRQPNAPSNDTPAE